jgi:two-component system phosphate regulon sensor histidine kinase PhoR
VQDGGPGIASGHIPRPTGRFHRVDAARSCAAGLGLSTVKYALQRHDAMLVPEVL